MKRVFTPKEISRITGLSYRQIQYWDRSGFIEPSLHTRGYYRRYTFADLVMLALAKALKDRDYSVQRLRRLMTDIAGLLPLSTFEDQDLTILIEDERVMIFAGETIVNTLADDRLVRFSVSELRAEVERLYPQAPSRVVALSRVG